LRSIISFCQDLLGNSEFDDNLEELFGGEIEDYYDNADCSEYEEEYLN
jgi:hypothetical protein